MELLCPECLAPLQSVDGRTAKCSTHGGEFQILFTRWPLLSPAPANQPPVLPAIGAACTHHPSVPAVYGCVGCGMPICATCDFLQLDGSHLCPSCAQKQAGAPPIIGSAAALPAGVTCAQHPNVAATAQCKVCGHFMCQTCTFDLPGGIRICPTCATAAPKLSPKRKKLLVGSYLLAAWCTIFMIAMATGIFRGMVHDKAEEELLGLVVMFLLVVPSIIGVALGVSSMDRRLSNSIAMWIATVWNGVILAGFILLMIVGMLNR